MFLIIAFISLFDVWSFKFSDVATVVGFSVVSRPFLSKKSTRHVNSTHSERMEVSRIQDSDWLSVFPACRFD